VSSEYRTWKYQVGTRVRVLPSAHIDVAGVAWPYLNGRIGTVKSVNSAAQAMGEAYIAYNVQFDEPFKGGWDCSGTCSDSMGQQISQQHLEQV
jgi:hypothetical protein